MFYQKLTLMTIADLIQNVIDSSKERIKNPIVGAFICSFLIFNWRPISILFSSSIPIQCRIATINDEYCTKWAILVPIVVALIYTLIVPVVMIGIDYCLMPIKRVRIANIYKNKDFTTDKKIELAGKEYLLKNAESGNKERDELLEKIKVLEDTNQQIKESHNNTVKNLNNELQEANTLVEKQTDSIALLRIETDRARNEYNEISKDNDNLKESLKLLDGFMELLAKLNLFDIKMLDNLYSNKILVNPTEQTLESMERLTDLGLAKNHKITSLGTFLMQKVNSLNINFKEL